MGFPKNFSRKLLAVIPAVFLMVLCNVFIAFSAAGVVLLQMLSSGINKHICLGVSLLIAVGVHIYIAYNHKIKNYINQGATNE